jgi:UrcA family protein
MTQVTHKLSGTRFFGMTLAALAAVAVIGTAHAATPTEARSLKVTYSDLNLESAAGTQVLYSRIVSAARNVCAAQDVDNRDLHAVKQELQCENQAIAEAVSSVHSPRLAALYNDRVARG